ncbi:hypothetical protein WA026_023854 [Henosepilachna vigintioctopunctata]|uniref:Uncharacterized protein n=1 Tax=Henosepilachna vigintioctopunctata TaxID=420089 RepID=A0AAW1UHH1_9CUCU
MPQTGNRRTCYPQDRPLDPRQTHIPGELLAGSGPASPLSCYPTRPWESSTHCVQKGRLCHHEVDWWSSGCTTSTDTLRKIMPSIFSFFVHSTSFCIISERGLGILHSPFMTMIYVYSTATFKFLSNIHSGIRAVEFLTFCSIYGLSGDCIIRVMSSVYATAFSSCMYGNFSTCGNCVVHDVIQDPVPPLDGRGLFFGIPCPTHSTDIHIGLKEDESSGSLFFFGSKITLNVFHISGNVRAFIFLTLCAWVYLSLWDNNPSHKAVACLATAPPYQVRQSRILAGEDLAIRL